MYRYKKVFLFTIVVFIYTNVSAQVEKRVKADVKGVTVYTRGAQVFSEARSEADAGFTKFIITGLPNDLNPNQIKVSGRGDAQMVAVDYKVKPDYQLAKTKELTLAEDSLDHLQFEMDSLKNTVETLKEEEKLLLANQRIGGENTGVKSTELEDVADVYRERLVQIKNLIWKTEYRKKKLDDKYRRQKDRVNALQTQRKKLSGELSVTVYAASKTAIVLAADYFTNDAFWKPTYDIKVKSTSEPVQWVYKAQVQQQTGVPWKDVKLTLSTFKPDSENGLPNFMVQRLKAKTNDEQPAYTKKTVMRANIQATYGAAETDNLLPAMPSAGIADEIENDVSVVYEIKQEYSVPSQPQSQQVEIAVKTILGKFIRVAMPKYNPAVYLSAIFTDWDKLNLLPAEASVFWAGSYTGQTYINPATLADTLTIPLAKDANVLISREILKDFSSKKLIGTNKVDEYAYLITVKNTNKTPVDVKVVDQIPVSGDNQIQIEFKNDTQAVWEQETGKLIWQLNLGASETKKIMYKYLVKYPKSVTVVGW